MKRTKIVATLGPKSDSKETMKKMIKEGVNVFRFNFSHGTHEYHLSNLEKVRQAEEETHSHIGTLQDISGPKVRVKNVEGEISLSPGDKVALFRDEVKYEIDENGIHNLCLNYPNILRKVEIGEKIFFADGTIEIKVIEKHSEKLVCELVNQGTLKPNKGVNFPDTEIDIDILTEKDKKDIEFGVINEYTFMALSFVQNKNDIIYAKKTIEHFATKHNKPIPMIIAKIEKFDAVDNIDEILEEVDALMIARGDLGIEVPYYKVPNIQKELTKKANQLGKPVILATQVLLSMTENTRATRAEISDVANGVADGVDAIMLSEETAVGIDPVNVIQTMSNTIKESEKKYNFYKKINIDSDLEAMSFSTVQLAKHQNYRKIFVLTTTGTTAKSIAKFRPKAKIRAISHTKIGARRLAVVWGVKTDYILEKDHSETGDFITEMVQMGLKHNKIELDKKYVVVASYPAHKPGKINFIRALEKEDIEYFNSKDLK